MDCYHREQAPDERLKFYAQLLHEPERPEPDNSHQAIQRGLGYVLDSVLGLIAFIGYFH